VNAVECKVTAADGKSWELPQVYAWDICHTFGSPCDSFDVRLPFTAQCREILEKAVYFSADHNGKAVFRGIVDEFEIDFSAKGAAVSIRGRGMQARLLDNEAESAQHYMLSFETLLDTYVRPFGIDNIDVGRAFGAKGAMTVDSGTSCWNVVSSFCKFHADTMPRFSADGTFCVDGEKGGNTLIVDDTIPISSLNYCEDRYGVISSVIVKNKARGTKTLVSNGKYSEKGLSCRRVITVPRSTRYDAMRHTGAYQIAQSECALITLQITVPWEFAAFAGDTVIFDHSLTGLKGKYIVYESQCTADAEGVRTKLELRSDRD